MIPEEFNLLQDGIEQPDEDLFVNPLINYLEQAIPTELLPDYNQVLNHIAPIDFQKTWKDKGEAVVKLGAALDYYFELQSDYGNTAYAYQELQKEHYQLRVNG